jgi:hypothetical protein
MTSHHCIDNERQSITLNSELHPKSKSRSAHWPTGLMEHEFPVVTYREPLAASREPLAASREPLDKHHLIVTFT